MSTRRKSNPYRFLLKKSIRPLLWIVLLFCFKHDIKREDFVFIPMEASLVMALIVLSDIYDVIDQYMQNVDSGKMCSFAKWKKYKQEFYA